MLEMNMLLFYCEARSVRAANTAAQRQPGLVCLVLGCAEREGNLRHQGVCGGREICRTSRSGVGRQVR